MYLCLLLGLPGERVPGLAFFVGEAPLTKDPSMVLSSSKCRWSVGRENKDRTEILGKNGYGICSDKLRKNWNRATLKQPDPTNVAKKCSKLRKQINK